MVVLLLVCLIRKQRVLNDGEQVAADHVSTSTPAEVRNVPAFAPLADIELDFIDRIIGENVYEEIN